MRQVSDLGVGIWGFGFGAGASNRFSLLAVAATFAG